MKKIIGYSILSIMVAGYIYMQIKIHGLETFIGGVVLFILIFAILLIALKLIGFI